MTLLRWIPIAVMAATLACSTSNGTSGDAGTDTLAANRGAPEDPVPMLDLEVAEVVGLNQAWSGDYNDLGDRRFIRALVPYNQTLYFMDRGEQHGVAFEAIRELEKALPAIPGRVGPAPKIVIIPTRRDRLLTALAAGYGDFAVGGFTITPERAKMVEFSQATSGGIEHVLVTGPGVTPVTREEDLGGLEIHVRTGSTYQDDLVALNGRLKARNLPLVVIRASDGLLEDEDVLQMVDAGIIPATLMRRQLAHFWGQHFDKLVVHDSVTLRTGSETGWAVRKGAPDLLGIINGFVKTHRVGTQFGNVVIRRYFGKTDRLDNPSSQAELARFKQLSSLLKSQAEQRDQEWLLLTAQGYQESRLDQSKRSSAGAIGVMQIKPSTAADPNVGVKDVTNAAGNIEAASKYMRFLADRYFDDPAIDRLNRGLFTLAAYNAGPARIRGLRKKTEEAGLDPNVWFGNVEIAAAKSIGRETVDYVSNIYKYYVAYKAIAAITDSGTAR